MASRLCLILLGGFEARLASGTPLLLPNNKAQALLAYLAMAPGRPHLRDKLATLLWPGTGDDQARQSLRQALVTLRRALGAQPILFADHREVTLEGDSLDIDVVRFEALMAESSVAALETAAALYHGDLLEGVRVKEPPFDEWLQRERGRLRELAQQGLLTLLTHQLGSGPVGPAIRTALRILALDPAQEAVHRELMRLFQRQGRRGDALRQYRLCVDALQRELGMEPQPETRRLYQEIVRSERVWPEPADAGPTVIGASSPAVVSEEPLRASAPLVGRATELARLGQGLDAAERGHGRLVLVLGEAGSGKSSLLEALEAESRRRGVRCHLGRAYLSGQVLAFAPWIEALRAGDVVGNAPLLASLGPAWVDELSRLIPDIGARHADRASEPGAQRLFEAVARLVVCLASQQPCVIMLEDFHWADEMSLRLLAFVARRIGGARALVVATLREEEAAGTPMLAHLLHELVDDPQVDRIALSPLSRADTETLVRSLTRADLDASTVARLAEQIFTSSGGNPFLVVETMRALAEGTVPQTSAGLPLPERARHVISGRLERLGERSKSLLAIASVIGREFDFVLLKGATELEEADAAEEVEALVRRRVLRVVGERFDFVHDQVREVVYGRLLPPRRALLHASVVRAIEWLHGGRLREHVERLAHHAFHGEMWTKAVAYGQQAGTIAAERSASAQAGACFDQALHAIARLPESRETLTQAIELRRLRSAHHFALGERAGLLQRMEEAVALAERLGDEQRLAINLGARAISLWFAGDNGRALEPGRRAVALAEAIGDPTAQISTMVDLGTIWSTIGDHHHAVGLLTRAMALLRGDLERERLGRTIYPCVHALNRLARSQAELGEFDSARATAGESLRIAGGLQHTTTLLVARLDACHVLLCQADFCDAIPRLESCLEAFQTVSLPVFSSAAGAMLGYARAMTDQPEDGIPLLREALEQIAQGRRTMEALFTTYLCEAHLLARQLGEAAALAERALALSRERFERATEVRALYLLGEIATLSAEEDTADRAYHDALALADELCLRPLVAQCHLGLGKLDRRADRPLEAHDHLTTAATMFREMAMRFWLEKVEAELRALTCPDRRAERNTNEDSGGSAHDGL
jgi:DNA-binding SARP family transcriptional activator/tetratricopeptide (TPR) repeat protein